MTETPPRGDGHVVDATPYTVTVQRTIAAPAEAIFALVADPSRHHEFDGSGTVRDVASGGGIVDGLGAAFDMKMRLGVGYTMHNQVVEFEPDRRIAWQTTAPSRLLGKLAGGRIWRYELSPTEDGTVVRESWDLTHERGRAVVFRALRRRTTAAMLATLDRIAVLTAEAD